MSWFSTKPEDQNSWEPQFQKKTNPLHLPELQVDYFLLFQTKCQELSFWLEVVILSLSLMYHYQFAAVVFGLSILLLLQMFFLH